MLLCQRVWRASPLGLDFDVGDAIPVGQWFAIWIREAPSEEVIWDSVCLMWTFWCMRSDVLFQRGGKVM